MNCFIMKTRTLDNEWYQFSIADIPTLQTSDQFVLMNKPDTPILKMDSIIRGDEETGLFEGDVIRANGDTWLVCYERGFRVINSNYVIKYLYHLDDFQVIGRHNEISGLPFITFKTKFLFKYKERVFRLNDIVGAYDGKVILRTQSKPVSALDIQQDCGIRINKQLSYLGDNIDGSEISLHGGRVTYCNSEGNYVDIATGGVLDDYIPRGIG